MDSPLAVRARGLGRQFAPGVGVEGLDLDVEAGTIFGFIGPSGSGKTTTIRLLTGITAPDRGEASVAGRSPSQFDRSDRTRLGYMPQLSVLYDHLTIWQNLTFAASIFGMPRRERRRRIREELEAVDLADAADRKLGDASGGMKRRVALAATLVHDPELLFLDEPTTGVDAVSRREFWDLLGELRDAGLTIVVSTPYMDEAGRCDRVALVQQGRILVVDEPAAIGRGYPYPLYAVVARDRYRLLGELRRFPHARSVYPFGAALHYADARADVAPGQVESEIRAYLSGGGFDNLHVEPIDAGIEDAFMALMRSSGEES